MAVRRRSRPNVGYGLDNSLQDLFPQAVVSSRAPTSNDTAEIATIWIDQTNDAVYQLTTVVAGSANWSTAAASGATTLASLIVTTTSDLQGNTDVGGTLDVVGLTTVDDFTATGTTTINGDLDLSSAALIDLTSTLNADPAIYLHANGGTSEVIRLRADQGTAADSIDLVSDVGGITITATGLASADAINLSAASGGVDIDGALQVNIASSQAATTAIVLNTSNAAGGVDVNSGTGGTILDSTGAISLDAAAASNFSVSGAGIDLDFASTGGRIISTSGEDAADSIYLRANAGTSETVRIHSDQGTGAASVGLVSDVGGITLTAGLAADAILLAATSGSIVATAGEDAADAIYLHADAGVSEVIRLHSDQGTGVASVHLESDVGGITLTATGLASDDAINLSAAAGGVDVDAALQLNLASSENAADAIVISASAGGIDMTAAGAAAEDIDIVCTAGSVNITGGEAIATAVTIQASNAAGGIDISAGTGDLDLDATGNVNLTSTLDAASAMYLRVNGGTSETLKIHADQSTAAAAIEVLADVGGITATSGLNAADCILIHSDAGTSETIKIRSDQGTAIGSISLLSDVGGVLCTTGALAATTGLHITQSAQTVALQVGTGAPSHNSPKGSLYMRTDGSSTSTRAYIATDAVGTWTALTTAA